MKRLVVCCDGTWQRLASPFPTNIERIAQSVPGLSPDGVPQLIYYHEGIGTGDKVDKLMGGAFGFGIDENIQNAYLFLALNYDPGDEIYLFGFSRGAYTVRSLTGLLNRCGLVRRQRIREIPSAYLWYRTPQLTSGQQRELADFRVAHCIDCQVDLLGCFDTVGALGIPSQIPWLPIDRIVNERYRFHNTTVCKIAKHALHACAIDERRQSFDLTPMLRNPEVDKQCVEQMWFIGDHGCVGGGDLAKTPLSNIALRWMTSRMEELGLGLLLDFSAQPDQLAVDEWLDFGLDDQLIYQLMGKTNRVINPETDAIHATALRRFVEDDNYRPLTLIDAL
jgi:uncharacterized protein (DUF2235 family)